MHKGHCECTLNSQGTNIARSSKSTVQSCGAYILVIVDAAESMVIPVYFYGKIEFVPSLFT